MCQSHGFCGIFGDEFKGALCAWWVLKDFFGCPEVDFHLDGDSVLITRNMKYNAGQPTPPKPTPFIRKALLLNL